MRAAANKSALLTDLRCNSTTPTLTYRHACLLYIRTPCKKFTASRVELQRILHSAPRGRLRNRHPITEVCKVDVPLPSGVVPGSFASRAGAWPLKSSQMGSADPLTGRSKINRMMSESRYRAGCSMSRCVDPVALRAAALGHAKSVGPAPRRCRAGRTGRLVSS